MSKFILSFIVQSKVIHIHKHYMFLTVSSKRLREWIMVVAFISFNCSSQAKHKVLDNLANSFVVNDYVNKDLSKIQKHFSFSSLVWKASFYASVNFKLEEIKNPKKLKWNSIKVKTNLTQVWISPHEWSFSVRI